MQARKRVSQLQHNGRLLRGTHAYPGANAPLGGAADRVPLLEVSVCAAPAGSWGGSLRRSRLSLSWNVTRNSGTGLLGLHLSLRELFSLL